MRVHEGLPSFFLLGAAKAGTTSLYSYLKQHSEVCLSSVKEPHFFDHEPTFDHGLDWYLDRYFSHCGVGQMRGEATPMLHLPQLAGSRMRKAYGCNARDLRFVIVLRDPVERAWSHYLNRCRLVTEPMDFETAMSLENERLAENPGDWCGYYTDGLYADQLEAWFGLFEREQFCVFLHEDLKNSPHEVMEKLCGFLSINDSYQFTTNFRSNVASRPRSRYLMRVVSRPPGFVRFATSRLLQQPTRKRIRATLRKWLSEPYNVKPQLDPRIASALRAEYQLDIQRLEALIDRDLSNWKK